MRLCPFESWSLGEHVEHEKGVGGVRVERPGEKQAERLRGAQIVQRLCLLKALRTFQSTLMVLRWLASSDD